MSESLGAKINRQSFEKHQREIAAERQLVADYVNGLEQRLASIADILGPKLTYALSDYESPHNVMVGPFTDTQARELQALLERR